MPRSAPHLPLPPYAYVPGKSPHPMSHPDGHRLGNLAFQSETLVPTDWESCDAYCYAIDLFNEGYYWEAHEVWEGCWNAAGRNGWPADFLKGLIKLAAALVKAREGRSAGVRRHARRALELIASPPGPPDLPAPADAHADRYAGLDRQQLCALARDLDRNAESWVSQAADHAMPGPCPLPLRMDAGPTTRA